MKKIKRLKVKVITNSSRDAVSKRADGLVKVKVTVSPEKGQANKRLKQLLSDQYNTKPGNINIVKGVTDSLKIIEILTKE